MSVAERFLLPAACVVGESRLRINEIAQPLRVAPQMFSREHAIGFGQRIHHAGKLTGEVEQHTRVLRTLAWEQRTESSAQLAGTERDTGRSGPGHPVWIRLEHPQRGAFQARTVGIPGHDYEQAEVRVALELLARPVRLASELEPGGIRRVRPDPFFQVAQLLAAEGEYLHVAIPIHRGLGGAVLFQHAVKIRAAEAQGADAGAAWMFLARQPGAFTGVDIERRAARHSLLDRLGDLDGRRKDFLVQRHCRLDHARDACRGLGVANLRLHRTERAPGAGLLRGLEDFDQ